MAERAHPLDTRERHALLELARLAAREAADLVVSERTRGVQVLATKSSATDVVTAVDRASESLIRAVISAERPHDGFLGEEGGGASGTTGVRWIVDPIDGTVNFVTGFPEYAVSVAAEYAGEVVAGVVRHVPRRLEYAGLLGGGAFRDGERLRLGPARDLSQALVGTGFGYAAELRRTQAEAVGRMLPQIGDIRRAGSCALDLCYVAEGSLDAYIEEGVHMWDYAAGGLIAREAGAVTRLAQGAGGGELFAAALPGVFPRLWALAEECGFLA